MVPENHYPPLPNRMPGTRMCICTEHECTCTGPDLTCTETEYANNSGKPALLVEETRAGEDKSMEDDMYVDISLWDDETSEGETRNTIREARILDNDVSVYSGGIDAPSLDTLLSSEDTSIRFVKSGQAKTMDNPDKKTSDQYEKVGRRYKHDGLTVEEMHSRSPRYLKSSAVTQSLQYELNNMPRDTAKKYNIIMKGVNKFRKVIVGHLVGEKSP